MLVSTVLLLFYKALPGVFFARLPWSTIFYGPVRFGAVGNRNIVVGNHCSFGKGVYISIGRNARLEIGDRSGINTGGHVVAIHGISIGRDTMIGEYVTIRDQNHEYKDRGSPINKQGFKGGRIVIGNDVWIGRGVFIGPNVVIEDGCVVGANSVVVKPLPGYSVASGVPASVLRMRRG